jgi:hypothetical protein
MAKIERFEDLICWQKAGKFSKKFLILVLYVLCIISFNECNFYTPERPSNVPKTAMYKSNFIKGGNHWIDFPEKLNDSTYLCVIYGANGKLWSEREYVLDLKCSIRSYTIEDIRNNFDIYGVDYVRVKDDNAQGFCDLILNKSTNYP